MRRWYSSSSGYDGGWKSRISSSSSAPLRTFWPPAAMRRLPRTRIASRSAAESASWLSPSNAVASTPGSSAIPSRSRSRSNTLPRSAMVAGGDKARCSSARPWRFRSTGTRSGLLVMRNQITLPRRRVSPMKASSQANTAAATPGHRPFLAAGRAELRGRRDMRGVLAGGARGLAPGDPRREDRDAVGVDLGERLGTAAAPREVRVALLLVRDGHGDLERAGVGHQGGRERRGRLDQQTKRDAALQEQRLARPTAQRDDRAAILRRELPPLARRGPPFSIVDDHGGREARGAAELIAQGGLDQLQRPVGIARLHLRQVGPAEP